MYHVWVLYTKRRRRRFRVGDIEERRVVVFRPYVRPSVVFAVAAHVATTFFPLCCLIHLYTCDWQLGRLLQKWLPASATFVYCIQLSNCKSSFKKQTTFL